MIAPGEIALLLSTGGLQCELPYFFWPKILRGNRCVAAMGVGPLPRRRACASKRFSRTQRPKHFTADDMPLDFTCAIPNTLHTGIAPKPL